MPGIARFRHPFRIVNQVMIVYGNDAVQVSVKSCLSQLLEISSRVNELAAVAGRAANPLEASAAFVDAAARVDLPAPPGDGGVNHLDALRALLIMTGQLEQGVLDALEGHGSASVSGFEEATARAARIFLAESGLLATSTSSESAANAESLDAALAGFIDHLRKLDRQPDVQIPLRIPEGFSYYALFPEAYAAAAAEWLSDHASPANDVVAIVGIRTIGTTLVATVRTVLESAGRTVISTTARPAGPPFERRVELPAEWAEAAAKASYALVVDEGPGLSGTSMAATADALVRAGIEPGRIAFLPGHGGDPGPHAPDWSRQWWESVPRYVVPLERLRFGGRPATEALAERINDITGQRDPIRSIEEIGAGRWRASGLIPPDAWPAVSPVFERLKYRLTARSGRRWLAAFAGLAGTRDFECQAGREAQRLSSLAAAGWTPECLGHALGFTLSRWVDGTPLRSADVNIETVAHAAKYLGRTSGPPLEAREAAAAVARLDEMLYWNVRESFGEEVAERLRGAAGAAEPLPPALASEGEPSYTDGRMALHEWLRTPDGKILKTDAGGHTEDHTVVGRQSLAWDLAGLIIEWNLDEELTSEFVDDITLETRFDWCDERRLRFYQLAYCAFRAGWCQTALDVSFDPDETLRLERALARYEQYLTRLIEKATNVSRPSEALHL